MANLSEFLRVLSLFDKTESGTLRLRQLVAPHAVRCKQMYGAGIVSTVLVHKIKDLVAQACDEIAPLDGSEANLRIEILSLGLETNPA